MPTHSFFAAFTLSLCAASALAVDVGHVDEFADKGELANFSGGSFHSNPGTGGVGGPNDGYLRLENFNPGNFGTRSASAPYLGQWDVDGATGVAYWLRNVSGANFEIHFSLGSSQNFWQYNIGTVPNAEWQRVIVTFDEPSQWTRIVGSGSFAECLNFADRIHFRHDIPPFIQNPEDIVGVLGIDRIKILGECPGDTNRDYLVNFTDLNSVLADFGLTGGNPAGDVNGDGIVNFSDLNEVLAGFGVDCAAP
jgi:hypothetical protein